MGDHWKIGRKNVGDGLLLLVAKDDRRVRIEVAKTLEGAIPDIAAKDIIDQAITPFFKQGQYAAGLEAGVDQIGARVRGDEMDLRVPSTTGLADSLRTVFFRAPVPSGCTLMLVLSNDTASILICTTCACCNCSKARSSTPDFAQRLMRV